MRQTKALRKYILPGPDSLRFQLDLHNVNCLLTPIARGLETLEGQNTTCSDVFHVYVGIAINFVFMFSDSGESPIGALAHASSGADDFNCHATTASSVYEYRKPTFDVYNCRFNNFMNDCTPGMFILAYLLDPSRCKGSHCISANMKLVYYQDRALQLNLPPTADQFKKNTVNDLVKHLIQSACEILQNEQLRTQQGTKEDGRLLIQQLRGT